MTKRLFVFIVILLLSPFFSSNKDAHFAYAQPTGNNGIDVELGVTGCNNNGICEADTGETAFSCPVDCAVVPPPPGGGGGIIGSHLPGDLYIYNISIEPSFTSADIFWDSSVSTISTLKWGETTEVKEGILRSVVFAIHHKMEIIHLKPGTLYYVTIESQDVDGRKNINQPLYFFTKFLIDTTYPLNPLNVKAGADIRGITLTWENPPDPNFSYIRIMRHEDRLRGDPLLGTLIYEGSEETFLDKNVQEGKKYYYTVFARNNDERYSSGVGVSATAYSPNEIPIQTPEIPPEVFISETFFVHQYNHLVEPLTSSKTIAIDSSKSTVVDINSKTFPDDVMKVTNLKGEVIGQYLFSFNADSGRFQSVIPPLLAEGVYGVKIYRYKNNVPTIISEGSLNAVENAVIVVPETHPNSYLNYYSFLLIFFVFLLLLIFFLKRRRKARENQVTTLVK